MSTLTPAKPSRSTVPDGCPLTATELRTLQLSARGLTNRQIAGRIDRTPSTVGGQMWRAYRRLEVSTRADALRVCEQNGWLTDEIVLELPPRPDPELTATQRAYLREFDRFLASTSTGGTVMARRRMTALLDGMFWERSLLPPSLRRR